MQKWEYLRVVIDIGFGFDREFTIKENGKVSHTGVVKNNQEYEELTCQLLESYGEQGWELIATAKDFHAFKRPKE